MLRLPTLLLVLLLPASLPAQPPSADDEKALRTYLIAHYTKFEYRIPMRDGVKLFTAVYVPKGPWLATHPILLNRTPYGVGPYGEDQYPARLGPSPLYMKAGYIFASQDVRGRMKSEGVFDDMRPHNPNKKGRDIDESSDTYDTIDWLVKNIPGNNGNVGIVGISYPGFYAACGMIDAHPALKAASPQAPIMDFFDGDDWRHNGALLLTHNFGFEAIFSKMTPNSARRPGSTDFDYGTADGYKFFLEMGPLANADALHLKGSSKNWTEVMKHSNYDDYCKPRNLQPHLRNIKPAVLTVGGWFDAEDLAGTLRCYDHVKESSPDCPQNVIVMGPWVHGGWARTDGDALGPVKFNAKTSEFYRENIEFPFFERHLRGTGTNTLPKAAVMFETGTNRWRRFDAWPPPEARTVKLSFAPEGKLSVGGLRVIHTQDRGFDEYVSDPAKPVPYVEKTVMRMDKEYMTADQRFAGRRTDVLVYQSPVLTEDMNVAGPIAVELHVSTSGTDSDFVVKLIDVYPDDFPDPEPNPTGVRMGGYEQLVRGEPFRGKYRNSLEKPEPFVPGQPALLTFAMPAVCHSFRAGHRIMVQVQSSWFPFIDRNPQTFCDIPTAKEADFQKATQRVYRSAAMPSGVTLHVIK